MARDPARFNDALFELKVHQVLRTLGLCVEIEPELRGTDEKIDFFAYPGNCKEKSFYLEATEAGFGQGNLHSSTDEYNAVEKLRQHILNPHSDLWLEADGTLSQTLNAQRVARPFLELLKKYSSEDVLQIASSEQHWNLPYAEFTVPVTENKRKKWVLKGQLRPPLHPSGIGQVIGPSRGGACNASISLRTSLEDKAEKWHRFDFRGAPFLVAVNACHSEFFWYEGDTMDIRKALFSDSGNEGQSSEFCPSLHCISGVVLFNHALLGNEIGSRVQLFRNGSATIPEPLLFLLEGQRLGKLLGIES